MTVDEFAQKLRRNHTLIFDAYLNHYREQHGKWPEVAFVPEGLLIMLIESGKVTRAGFYLIGQKNSVKLRKAKSEEKVRLE